MKETSDYKDWQDERDDRNFEVLVEGAGPTQAEVRPVIPGSVWQHYNGNIYTVLDVYNLNSERLGEYPHTIAYQGQNGNKWTRGLDDWHRSMTYVPRLNMGKV